MASYNTLGAPQPPPARPDPRPWAVLGAACLTAAAILSLSMVSASPSALYTAVSATTVTKPSVATPAPWQRGATAQRRTEAYVDQWTEGPGAAQAPRLRVGNGIFQTPLAHAVYRPTLAMFGIMGVLMMGLRYLQPSTRAPTGASAAAPSALCMAAVTGTEITREDVPLDQEEGEAPLNAYTKDTPFEGVVRSVEKITGPDALGETYHIVVDTAGQVQCREGHCYGVIPPGVDVDKDGNEKPHYARLYTVAASRYGDTCDGQTTSLCVKKIAWWDPSIGGMKKELCSHFLCEATPGTTLTMTGPAGKAMLLDEDPDAVHICVATGTGIAPYRAFWRRMFYENVPGYQFKGRVLLYFGDGNADGLLYAQELADLQVRRPQAPHQQGDLGHLCISESESQSPTA